MIINLLQIADLKLGQGRTLLFIIKTNNFLLQTILIKELCDNIDIFLIEHMLKLSYIL